MQSRTSMGIPMAVTSLGMGISGVGDIGGGGADFSQQQLDPKPDPQYPNTSGVQRLDEVNLGFVKKKDKGCDNCPTVWGYGTEDLGNKRGTRKGDFDMSEMPTGTGGARPTPSRFMNFWRDLLDILGFADDGKDAIDKYLPNESSMENANEEPVDPPEETKTVELEKVTPHFRRWNYETIDLVTTTSYDTVVKKTVSTDSLIRSKDSINKSKIDKARKKFNERYKN